MDSATKCVERLVIGSKLVLSDGRIAEVTKLTAKGRDRVITTRVGTLTLPRTETVTVVHGPFPRNVVIL